MGLHTASCIINSKRDIYSSITHISYNKSTSKKLTSDMVHVAVTIILYHGRIKYSTEQIIQNPKYRNKFRIFLPIFVSHRKKYSKQKTFFWKNIGMSMYPSLFRSSCLSACIKNKYQYAVPFFFNFQYKLIFVHYLC